MRSPKQRNLAANCPTPEEITRRTAIIRSQWSRRQHRVRAGLPPKENASEIAVVPSGIFTTRHGLADRD